MQPKSYSLLLFHQLNDLTHLSSKDEDGAKSDAVDTNKVIAPRIMASALQAICAVEKVDPVDAEKIALISMIPAHHSCIGLCS